MWPQLPLLSENVASDYIQALARQRPQDAYHFLTWLLISGVRGQPNVTRATVAAVLWHLLLTTSYPLVRRQRQQSVFWRIVRMPSLQSGNYLLAQIQKNSSCVPGMPTPRFRAAWRLGWQQTLKTLGHHSDDDEGIASCFNRKKTATLKSHFGNLSNEFR